MTREMIETIRALAQDRDFYGLPIPQLCDLAIKGLGGMTLERAREIMKDEIQPDGGLFNGGHYLAWTPGEDMATLDCKFTADELEAIAIYMRSSAK